MCYHWNNCPAERLYLGGVLIANGQPTTKHIQTELNRVATKQFSCIFAPKSSLSISMYVLRKKFASCSSPQGLREGSRETMTADPKDFKGPFKITLKSEQRSLLCKQHADIILTLEQRSHSNTVFCQQIGLLLFGGELIKDGALITS